MIHGLEVGRQDHSSLPRLPGRRDFPPHPSEAKYGFATCSTLKPTQWSYPGGSINQIPGQVGHGLALLTGLPICC